MPQLQPLRFYSPQEIETFLKSVRGKRIEGIPFTHHFLIDKNGHTYFLPDLLNLTDAQIKSYEPIELITTGYSCSSNNSEKNNTLNLTELKKSFLENSSNLKTFFEPLVVNLDLASFLSENGFDNKNLSFENFKCPLGHDFMLAPLISTTSNRSFGHEWVKKLSQSTQDDPFSKNPTTLENLLPNIAFSDTAQIYLILIIERHNNKQPFANDLAISDIEELITQFNLNKKMIEENIQRLNQSRSSLNITLGDDISLKIKQLNDLQTTQQATHHELLKQREDQTNGVAVAITLLRPMLIVIAYMVTFFVLQQLDIFPSSLLADFRFYGLYVGILPLVAGQLITTVTKSLTLDKKITAIEQSLAETKNNLLSLSQLSKLHPLAIQVLYYEHIISQLNEPLKILSAQQSLETQQPTIYPSPLQKNPTNDSNSSGIEAKPSSSSPNNEDEGLRRRHVR